MISDITACALYVDGILQTVQSTNITGGAPTGNWDTGLTIGANVDGGNHCESYISDFAWYNTILTTAQIASNIKTMYNGGEPYNHKEGIMSSYLKGWWRMGDGSLDSFITNVAGSDTGLIANEVDATIGSELVTGWTNNDYGTCTIDGTDITQAISDGSGNHEFYSNNINTTAGDVYKVTFTIAGTPGSNLDFNFAAATTLSSAQWVSGNLSTGTVSSLENPVRLKAITGSITFRLLSRMCPCR